MELQDQNGNKFVLMPVAVSDKPRDGWGRRGAKALCDLTLFVAVIGSGLIWFSYHPVDFRLPFGNYQEVSTTR